MTPIPSAQTPLNQHSLRALESWLNEIGAYRSLDESCLWTIANEKWSAQIRMEKDKLYVVWDYEGQSTSASFSYGLTQSDVQAAIEEGPLHTK